MAVKLRLMRMGKKKQPTYRVVAADARSPRNGRFIEIIGTYEPRQDPSVIKINNERAVHWLNHGAQPTERVAKILKISGAWTEHTGEAVDAAVPEAKSRKSARRIAKEAEAAEAAASGSADEATDEPAVAEAPAAEAETAPDASDEASADAASGADDDESAGNGGDGEDEA